MLAHAAAGGGHDPGRIAVDLAVMLADGEAVADLAVLRDQAGLSGPVADAGGAAGRPGRGP